MVTKIDSDNASKLNDGGVTVIDFWAPWCGPCRTLSPIIDKIAQKNQEVLVASVNVDENSDLAQEYGVRSIPTLVFKKDGKIVTRSVGMQSEETIQEYINQMN